MVAYMMLNREARTVRMDDGSVGWQMWETTSEGSPISPVFPSKDDLAFWLAKHRDIVDFRYTADQWMRIIDGDVVMSSISDGSLR